jgi:hypothetical protein
MEETYQAKQVIGYPRPEPIHVKQFADIMASTYQDLQHLSETKGMEYRQDNYSNVHDNFDRQAAEMNTAPEKVLMIFLNKHLDAIKTHIKRMDSELAPTPSEPIYGRVDDAILYLLLLKAMFMRGPFYLERRAQYLNDLQGKAEAVKLGARHGVGG